jgi:hypothetical protein
MIPYNNNVHYVEGRTAVVIVVMFDTVLEKLKNLFGCGRRNFQGRSQSLTRSCII